jgi:hypothetical protein
MDYDPFSLAKIYAGFANASGAFQLVFYPVIYGVNVYHP